MHSFFNDTKISLILPDVKADSTKKAFQIIAEETAPRCGLPVEDVLERLMDHEKMFSSGIGGGVSIPHMKFRRIDKPFTVLARLDRSVEFKAVDGEPVDLICMVMSPMKDGPVHLRRLARLTRMMRDRDLCERLRACTDAQAMLNAMMETEELQKAA